MKRVKDWRSMKLMRAIEILIRHAERDIAGTGHGERPAPTDTEMQEARDAVMVGWRFIDRQRELIAAQRHRKENRKG